MIQDLKKYDQTYMTAPIGTSITAKTLKPLQHLSFFELMDLSQILKLSTTHKTFACSTDFKALRRYDCLALEPPKTSLLQSGP